MTMTMRAVRIDSYGGRDVLYIADVDVGPGQVLVRSGRRVSTPERPRSVLARSGSLRDICPAK